MGLAQRRRDGAAWGRVARALLRIEEDAKGRTVAGRAYPHLTADRNLQGAEHSFQSATGQSVDFPSQLESHVQRCRAARSADARRRAGNDRRSPPARRAPRRPLTKANPSPQARNPCPPTLSYPHRLSISAILTG